MIIIIISMCYFFIQKLFQKHHKQNIKPHEILIIEETIVLVQMHLKIEDNVKSNHDKNEEIEKKDIV